MSSRKDFCFSRLKLLLLIVTVAAAADHNRTCTPSACGKVTTITHPFRLRGDPASCGDRRYELSCENNITLLYLFPGKTYHVEAINYNNFTIRLLDPAISENDCSTLPRYSLSLTNFSTFGDDYYYKTVAEVGTGKYEFLQERVSLNGSTPEENAVRMFEHVVFLNCTNPVRDDPRYVNTAPCIKQGGNNVYAVLGDLAVVELRDDCRVKLIAASSFLVPPRLYYDDSVFIEQNLAYSEIHKKLSYGFELSWMYEFACEDKCGMKNFCVFNEITQNITCGDPDNPVCDYTSLLNYKCGNVSKLQIIAQDFAYGILKGLRKVVNMDSGEHFSKRDVIPVVKVGLFMGLFLMSYIILKYSIGVMFFFALLIYTFRRRHISIYENIEDFLQGNTLMPIRYSYKEIKKMTRGFKEKLGEGGFGAVYKGKLQSGPFVAIKMLGKAKANGQEFISEVATIGRIHHANVVRLIGFCVEGSKRALIYEFMPNGSLDKYIFSKEESVSLTSQKMFEISLGVARGMAYLHEGCDMQILHFDIKPHNILLDENFIPKVSDFGLAKLYPLDNSIVSLTAARGTIGYMAPELFYQNIGAVSYKADVYSFGMLLMEIASQRRNSNPHAEHSSQLYFPFWIYDQLAAEENDEIEMETFVHEERSELAKKMFIIALWCIQLKPSDRPSMNKVVEMLEGDVASIEMPPKPSYCPNDVIQRDSEVDSSGVDASNNSYVSSSFEEESTSNPSLKFSA
ncbi:LEAF RUST 10 DISEASE-RESISTANCE LOCUS RECEPTOR-LIKE PROTEIN KINASE-like 2.1 [Arachis stenosperma]|uniref:LEAF RUST 10 DISEASE-RESISTANCE LOCUS RECEPTOR-LIKE PROTEIN KINASE-like 2.1 n=1 Tax=Arachis stenosperma TaxID=217475 RepID=UPI0025AC15E4|nr:LEAF RUST 10 DISEASE-RESISTANCE LOCUS RECEPTOR-LIKE PROTEIN KINASE-like 2.1 [Arachis stenosperma]